MSIRGKRYSLWRMFFQICPHAKIRIYVYISRYIFYIVLRDFLKNLTLAVDVKVAA